VSYSATGGRVGDLLTTKLASGTARATPSVTPPVGDYWVVGGVTNETDATTAMTFTPPTGWTERVDAATTTTPKFSNTVADVAVTGGAATSGSFTMSASDEALSWALVLGPVATIMRRVGKFVF
jgi:hypothetical protein